MKFKLSVLVCLLAALSCPSLGWAQDGSVEETSEETSKALYLIGNEFRIYYQNSLQSFSQDHTLISGWRENQLRASGQVLVQPQWLFTASMMGDRSDIELEHFNSNPAFSSDSFLTELSLNHLWQKHKNWALATGVGYLFYNYTPDNLDQSSSPIPYSNSISDFEHSLHGPGLYSMGVVHLFERLSLKGNLGLYPYLFGSVKKGEHIGYEMVGRGNLELRYAVLDGFLLSAFVNQEIWLGHFSNRNTSVGVGLTLVPDQIPEI